MYKNLTKPFHNIYVIVSYIALVVIASLLWWYFTDIKIMLGNYGKAHTYFDIGLSIFMILGFPLFIVGLMYKGITFGPKENLNTKSGVGLVSGLMGTILSGCSCCGLTLASYFGLLPLMGILPYDGLEIKVLGVLGLSWAIWDMYYHLDECRIPRKYFFFKK